MRPTFNIDGLIAIWQQGKVDAVVAYVDRSARHFLAMVGDAGGNLLAATPLFVPHPRIATHARNKGLVNIVTTEPTDAGILQSLLNHFHQP
jgi:uroporphyrinogen-III synthase